MREPAAALCAGACLLSMAGVPPLPGFWSKLFLLAAGLSVHLDSERGFLPHPNPALLLLGIIAVGCLMMSAAACFRFIAVMFLDGQVSRPEPAGGQPALSGALLVTMLLVGTGLLPGPLLGILDGIVLPPHISSTAKTNSPATNVISPANRTTPAGETGTDTPVPPAQSVAIPQ